MSSTDIPATRDVASVADVDVTPGAVLARLRAARRAADAAEVEVLVLAVEWAHAHPVLPGQEAWSVPGIPGCVDEAAPTDGADDDPEAELVGDELAGLPLVRWDAPAAFAAANAMTTDAGQSLIRDALTLRHRMPRVWARTLAGEVTAWRARRIAQAVLGRPDDVTTYVDTHVAPVAGTIGAVRLDRVVDEALLRLHAEERELAQLAALDSRYVRLDERTLNHTGIAELVVRGDWKDLHDLDATVSRLAVVLAEEGRAGHGLSLDVRRSMAVGVLADPAAATALLDGDRPSRPSSKTVLYLHLTDAGLCGLEPVGRNQTTGRPELEQVIRSWCGREDTHLVVQPVLDLAAHVHAEQYEVPDRLRDQVALREPQCVFPWCTRRAAACDCDHIHPHGAGGATCAHNLAPLCRRHHRLKTHARWRYRPLDPVTDPGVHLWTDPHGRHYLRGPTGTTDVTGVTDPIPRA
ncbi:HNH endonuclease signature motif containing protein [Nocardioides abyssi]|uniref:HNH endonuclease signature motif containing protein n=1 Tax=Nocardioides abyssi TaxID=3058370 RepID=A0ABT8EY44_9ACTN|nr:HNH endonuclease signature motif containing protein [Nocardioides abyssi]MDN4162989.1 HNH endonuclease signature motif containing protein [Nocardioides abyssi]